MGRPQANSTCTLFACILAQVGDFAPTPSSGLNSDPCGSQQPFAYLTPTLDAFPPLLSLFDRSVLRSNKDAAPPATSSHPALCSTPSPTGTPADPDKALQATEIIHLDP
jgi:hypothetical protein